MQVFYIIEGAVNFKVHEASYVLATGGMILVPRGNNYYIENICERDARLFFAQARKVIADEDEAAGAGGAVVGDRGSSTSRARSKSNEREKSQGRATVEEEDGGGGKKKKGASRV